MIDTRWKWFLARYICPRIGHRVEVVPVDVHGQTTEEVQHGGRIVRYVKVDTMAVRMCARCGDETAR